MPFKWNSPLASELLTNPTVVEQTHTDFNPLIQALHEGDAPIYYAGDGSDSSLDTFMRSAPFFNQMSRVIDKIITWLRENPVDIRDEHGNSVNPTHTLHTFLNNLLSPEHFSTQRPILHKDGKRYLEIIAILLPTANIDQNAKKTIMVDLLNENGLLHCAAGCFSRLQTTAMFLQNLSQDYQKCTHGSGKSSVKSHEKLRHNTRLA
jgi:hypothetical protein